MRFQWVIRGLSIHIMVPSTAEPYSRAKKREDGGAVTINLGPSWSIASASGPPRDAPEGDLPAAEWSLGAARLLLSSLIATGVCSFSTPARAQLNYIPYQYGDSTLTTVTGIRGDNMTGNYLANGGVTGGLLFRLSTGAIEPFPSATSGASNFPGATSSTPYGPSFGSSTGILRVGGSYKTVASNPNDLGYLYDGAAAPGGQLTTLVYPGGSTLNTLAHSTFGNQVVGNYDTMLATGNAFVYDIPSGTFTTNNRPGAVSTTAYGVYGNRIAGGYADPTLHGYIYNQSTGVFTRYDAPGAVVTHFEGITGGGRANTFNLVADSVDGSGNPHAWAVHVNASGVATWTEIAVPGASETSANSVYGDKVIGVYVQGGVTRAYAVSVPGLYDPVTNAGTIVSASTGAVGINGAGDDVVNSGNIQMTGANAIGISNGTYGVVTNTGTIGVTGAGGTAVQMTGSFSSLLNAGMISAAPGGFAIQTDGTAVGSLVVNTGTIDGRVAMAAGPDARFENSGWMGISAAGSGTTHTISGTYAQTAAGTLSLRASPTAADQLQVNGVARLAGTAQVVVQPGSRAPRTTYTVVSATGGLTGTFAGVTSSAPFLLPSLSYDAQNVYLTLQAGGFAAAAQTPNQSAVGAVLDVTAPTATGNYATVLGALSMLSVQQGQAAMTAISGQNYAGFSTAGVQNAQLFMSNFSAQAGGGGGANRVALAEACDVACDAASPATWGAWGGAIGGLGTIGASQSVGGLTYNLGGFAAGLDRQVTPNLLLGVTAGYTNGTQWVSGFQGTGTSNTFQTGLYGSFTQGALYVDGLAGYAYSDNQMQRLIAIPGLSSMTAQGRTGANQFFGQVESGYRVELGGAAEAFVTPFVRLQGATATQNAFSESGAGALSLNVAAQTTNSLRSVLGAQLGGAMDMGWRDKLALKFRLGWTHEYADTGRPVTSAFAGAPAVPFTTFGVSPQRDGILLGLSGSTVIADATSIFFRYEGDFSGQDASHALTAGVRIKW